MSCIVKEKNKILSKALCIIALCISGIYIYQCSSPSIINDEIFTLRLEQFNILKIISLTARDVHPPFYYLYLKAILVIGNMIGIPATYMGKFASVLPLLVLQAYAFFVIKKENKLMASAFALYIVAMPGFMVYGTQIRMYSLGMALVTATLFSARPLFKSSITFKKGLPFLIWSLLAAFTQYFALVCVIYIYLCILVKVLIYKERVKVWFMWVLIAVCAYTPWLVIAIRQITVINNEGYWIEPINLRTFIDYFQSIFNPYIYVAHSGTIVGVMFLLVIVSVIASNTRNLTLYRIAGLGTPVFLIAFGTVVSILSQPVFSERYIFLSLGAFAVGFLELLTVSGTNEEKECKNGKLVLVVCALLLFYGFANCKWFIRTENEYRQGWNDMFEVLNSEIGTDDKLVGNNGGIVKLLCLMYPENEVGYYWRQHLDPIFYEMYSNYTDLRDADSILDIINKNKVWLFDFNNNSEFHFMEDIADSQMGILEYETIGVYNIEGEYITLYKVWKK